MKRDTIRARLKAARCADQQIDIVRSVDLLDPAGFPEAAWRLKRKRTINAICTRVELEQRALFLP